MIEIYNRVTDEEDAEKIHTGKEELNASLKELGAAIRDKEDEKIARILEDAVVPFLNDLKTAAQM